MGVAIQWGLGATPATEQRYQDMNEVNNAFLASAQNRRQDAQDTRLQGTYQNQQDDRQNMIAAGKLAAVGDHAGAQAKMQQGGQIENAYKYDADQHAKMTRANGLLKDWSEQASRATTEAEYNYFEQSAKSQGADLSKFAVPGLNWEAKRNLARAHANYGASQIDQQLKIAQTAHAQSQADMGKYSTLKPGETLIDNKTGKPLMTTGTGQDSMAALTAKKAAEKTGEMMPGEISKANQAYNDAAGVHSSMDDLDVLKDHMISGKLADARLQTQKMLTAMGVKPETLGMVNKIAPTELAQTIMTNGVLAAAQKLKPMSNSDITFAERATASLSSDPSALPHIINSIRTAAKRDMMAKQLEAEYWRRGVVPDQQAIKSRVDEAVPEYTKQMFAKQKEASAQAGQRPQAAPQGAPQAAAPQGGPAPGHYVYDPKSGGLIGGNGQPVQAPSPQRRQPLPEMPATNEQ
jgi:hypothetical protein